MLVLYLSRQGEKWWWESEQDDGVMCSRGYLEYKNAKEKDKSKMIINLSNLDHSSIFFFSLSFFLFGLISLLFVPFSFLSDFNLFCFVLFTLVILLMRLSFYFRYSILLINWKIYFYWFLSRKKHKGLFGFFLIKKNQFLTEYNTLLNVY